MRYHNKRKNKAGAVNRGTIHLYDLHEKKQGQRLKTPPLPLF